MQMLYDFSKEGKLKAINKSKKFTKDCRYRDLIVIIKNWKKEKRR